MADETDPFPERHLRAKLRVTVTDGRGRPKAAGRLSTWLARTAPTAAVGLASVALVGDPKMRDLNRRFRAVDRVTDVLSFPAEPVPGVRSLGSTAFLGDIVIATGRARRQARAAGVTEQQEWTRPDGFRNDWSVKSSFEGLEPFVTRSDPSARIDHAAALPR